MRSHVHTAGVIAALLLLAAVATPRVAHAQYAQSPFGLGLRVGDPTAFTGKVWLDGRNAVQFDVGARATFVRSNRAYYSGPYVAADWVYQVKKLTPRSTSKVWFAFHVGAGGALGFVPGACYRDALGYYYCSTALSARAPLAFNIYLREPRFEFFVEFAPGLILVPGLAPTLVAGTGARFYF